jgi:two-component system sensor histidine kinase/response regulator
MTQPNNPTHAAPDLPTGALDLSVLDKMVGGNPMKFKKFALLFVSSMTDVMAQIEAAVAQGDLPTLAAMGHRAKSTAMNVGATGLSVQCLLLEQAAHAGERVSALSVAQGLKPMFTAVCAAIELRLADA